MTTETDTLIEMLRDSANDQRQWIPNSVRAQLRNAADALTQRDAEIARLRVVIADRDVDAERYRWIRARPAVMAWRENDYATICTFATVPKERGTCNVEVTSEAVDAAVDAARPAQPSGGGEG